MERDVGHTTAQFLRQSDKMGEDNQAVAELAAAEADHIMLRLGRRQAIERRDFERFALDRFRILWLHG